MVKYMCTLSGRLQLGRTLGRQPIRRPKCAITGTPRRFATLVKRPAGQLRIHGLSPKKGTTRTCPHNRDIPKKW